MERKIFPLEVKDVDAEGTFTAHGAIFGNLDRGGDIIRRGAFKRTLRQRKESGRPLKMLYQHSEPIGVYSEVKEDHKGLFVKGRPLVEEVQRAKEVVALMRAQALDEFSIGYEPIEHKINSDGTRTLLDIELHEVSIVPFAMNPEATLVGIKTEGFKTPQELIETLISGKEIDEELAEKIVGAAWPILHPPKKEEDLSQSVAAIQKLAAEMRPQS
jgi:HK97 family phage prohead protease